MSDARPARKFRLSAILTHQTILLIVLVGLVVVFGIIEPVFFKPRVLFDVFSIVGEIGLMAMAMTFIITTGGVDLGVGYNLQMSAIVFGLAWRATNNLALAMILTVLAGLAGGAFNGLIISRTKIPPLVTTLATMYLYRGISFILAGTDTFAGFPEPLFAVSTTKLFGFMPLQTIYLIVVFLIMDYFYERGALGRNLKGMGFNENAVIFSGVNTRRIKLGIYSLMGLLCGVAAVIYLGRLSAAKTSMGDYMNFEVITAVLLGGTSIMGGVGSMRGTLIGVLMIGVLKKGFTLLNFSGNIYNFTLGILLILSLIVFALEEERKRVSSREEAAVPATSPSAEQEPAGQGPPA